MNKARHGEDGTEMVINTPDEYLTAIALRTLQKTEEKTQTCRREIGLCAVEKSVGYGKDPARRCSA